MPVAISTDAAQTGWLKIHIVGNATAAGLVGQVYNPEGVQVQITDGYIYLSSASVAASTYNIGVGASGADASDLVSALAMNTTGVFAVIGKDLASEGAATTPKGLLWPSTSYITVTSAAQASTGLVADLYLRYIRLS